MVLQWLHSAVRSSVAIAALIAVAAAGTSASAQVATPQGNPHRGKELSYTCLGCHGVDGYKNAYPNYSVPELEGQHPEYLSAALHEYRDGDRAHLTMHSQASTLTDQDIADIVSYFSGKPLVTTGKSQGTVPQAAQLCTTCHGKDGVGITGQYPTLAGQHPDYLARAIEEYKKGGRKNPVMTGMAAQIKDEDIGTIADYFGSLKPSLSTESRPYTTLGEHEAAKEGR